MFTVCPKCALTLVVTAADLRVAQGYVRCGRCSNVFNALARLSDDRQAAAQPAPESAGTRATGSSARLRTSSAAGNATSGTRALEESTSSSRGADSQRRDVSPSSPSVAASASTRTTPSRAPSQQPADEDGIPDDALEFNAEATDVSKVFVEQPPTPEFKAATGTFRALRHDAETARVAGPTPAAGESRPGHEERAGVQFDIELDSELLAEITGNRLTRLDSTASARAASDRLAAERAAVSPSSDAHDSERRDPEPHDADADSGEIHIARLLTENAAPPLAAEAEMPPATPAAMGAAAMGSAAMGSAAMGSAAMGSAAVAPAAPGPAASGVSYAERPHAAALSATVSSPSSSMGSAPAGMARSGMGPKAALAKERMSPALAATAGGKPPASVASATRAVPTKRASPLETAEAIRNALSPRKKVQSAPASAQSRRRMDPAVLGWTIGTVLMGMLLVAQVVNHFRNDLAASAELHGPLTSLYAALGITLVPKWNLSSYEVRQLGATTDAESAGHITVRASVKNGAHQSKPLPFLRVTLQDRFGNRIASRDVPPQSYLPRAIPVTALLAPGQRIDAEMVFVDPGTNAVGFEIDACLPAPGGGISCANDVSSR